MPKLLDTPETLVEQQAVEINRKDIVSYTVDAPIAGALIVRRSVLARFIDPATQLPTDSRAYEPPPLVGDDVSALSARAGVRTMLRAIQLLNLAPDVTVQALTAALAAHPEAAAQAYYEGTRDALYETV